MRFEGTLKTWNENRGFGFIEPAQGGQEIFVHVSAISTRLGRPGIGQHLTFDIELNRDGKKRAVNIGLSQTQRTVRARAHDRPAHWSAASVLAIPIFIAIYVAVAVVWKVPAWVAVAYLALSVCCLFAYAFDKSAAVAGRWRISEQSLLLLGLAGGWPGGLVAQQMLRHKSTKASFRAAFWGTVVVNVAAFVLLHSPLMKGFRA